MARQHLGFMPLLLCASLLLASVATAQEASPSPEVYDVNKELEKLKGWKTYLTSEVEKHKAEIASTQAALQAEKQRTAELSSQMEQFKKASAEVETRAVAAEAKADGVAQLNAQLEQLKKDAEAAQVRAAAAEAKVVETTTKATDAEALAASHAQRVSQLSAQVEQFKKVAAAAEAKASAHALAADAANGEAALLRKQLAEAVAERQALDDRVTELANAASKAGGLRGHALAIYSILLDEVERHRENALNYANDKLPGLKAKVAEVHATVSSQMPDVTGHVNTFVSNVDGELRPWLRRTLGSVQALKPYSDDPVLLQGLTYVIIGAPVLLLLLPVLSVIFRALSRRPTSVSPGRGTETKAGARRNKKKQG